MQQDLDRLRRTIRPAREEVFMLEHEGIACSLDAVKARRSCNTIHRHCFLLRSRGFVNDEEGLSNLDSIESSNQQVKNCWELALMMQTRTGILPESRFVNFLERAKLLVIKECPEQPLLAGVVETNKDSKTGAVYHLFEVIADNLGTVNGFAQLLSLDFDDSSMPEDLKMIINESRAMKGTLEACRRTLPLGGFGDLSDSVALVS